MSKDGSAAEFSALPAAEDSYVLCDDAAGSLNRAGSNGEHPECCVTLGHLLSKP